MREGEREGREQLLILSTVCLLGLTPASEELSKLQGNQSPAAHLEEDSDEFYEAVDEEDERVGEKLDQID